MMVPDRHYIPNITISNSKSNSNPWCAVWWITWHSAGYGTPSSKYLTGVCPANQIPVVSGLIVVESTQDSGASNKTVHLSVVGDEVCVLHLLHSFGGGSKDFRTFSMVDLPVVWGVDSRLTVVEQLEFRSKR